MNDDDSPPLSPLLSRAALLGIVACVFVLLLVTLAVAPRGVSSRRARTAARRQEAARLAAQSDTIEGRLYSRDATFQAASKPVSGAILAIPGDGYPEAKQLCEATTQSRTAHLCTEQELERSRRPDGPLPDGWYAPVAYGFFPPQRCRPTDCGGEPGQPPRSAGLRWNGQAEEPSLAPCTAVLPLLCCD